MAQKPKIAVCVPTRGLIHARVAEWLLSFDARSFIPFFIFVIDLPMPDCREVLADKFLETSADYLFFLDDDTLPPLDCIEKLLAADKDIATGITWNKIADEHNRPMIGYQNPISGNIQWSMQWVYPDLFQVDGCGLSNCLIKRKVIEGMSKPRFDWNWKFTNHLGAITDIYQGEDIFFCLKAKAAGFEVWCNSDVRCQHIDIKTGRDYPSQELWDKFKRENLIADDVSKARVLVFDQRSGFNRQRAQEIVDAATAARGVS